MIRTVPYGIGSAGISLLALSIATAAGAQTSPPAGQPDAPIATPADAGTPPAGQNVVQDPAQVPAQTPTAVSASQYEGEIVVTANKREQKINDVGLSITAESGGALIQRGISSPTDLGKIVPGLTVQPSPFNTPVYTLRGVGFYETTLSAAPTVAVYVDEIQLPFSATTRGASFDLERVEVLKGPQGTLFGQNTTGGAINYVAAKPTDHFTMGVDASYGRFDTVDVQGFVSGPLSSTLKARLAARTIQSGPWQKSFTRDDKLGKQNQFQGRFQLQWDPVDTVRLLSTPMVGRTTAIRRPRRSRATAAR